MTFFRISQQQSTQQPSRATTESNKAQKSILPVVDAFSRDEKMLSKVGASGVMMRPSVLGPQARDMGIELHSKGSEPLATAIDNFGQQMRDIDNPERMGSSHRVLKNLISGMLFNPLLAGVWKPLLNQYIRQGTHHTAGCLDQLLQRMPCTAIKDKVEGQRNPLTTQFLVFFAEVVVDVIDDKLDDIIKGGGYSATDLILQVHDAIVEALDGMAQTEKDKLLVTRLENIDAQLNQLAARLKQSDD